MSLRVPSYHVSFVASQLPLPITAKVLHVWHDIKIPSDLSCVSLLLYDCNYAHCNWPDKRSRSAVHYLHTYTLVMHAAGSSSGFQHLTVPGRTDSNASADRATGRCDGNLLPSAEPATSFGGEQATWCKQCCQRYMYICWPMSVILILHGTVNVDSCTLHALLTQYPDAPCAVLCLAPWVLHVLQLCCNTEFVYCILCLQHWLW